MAKMILDPDLCAAWGDIEIEMNRARGLHPAVSSDALRFTAVLAEEAGEALKEALDLTRTRVPVDPESDACIQKRLYRETVQCASSAIINLVQMRRRGFARG